MGDGVEGEGLGGCDTRDVTLMNKNYIYFSDKWGRFFLFENDKDKVEHGSWLRIIKYNDTCTFYLKYF